MEINHKQSTVIGNSNLISSICQLIKYIDNQYFSSTQLLMRSNKERFDDHKLIIIKRDMVDIQYNIKG